MRRTGGRRWGRPQVRNRRNDALANLDPLEFERVVADYYRRQGYRVEHSGTGGGYRRFDGGIDLKMYRDGEYTIVQCKRENALQVTHNVGHELLGILSTEGADHAIVVNAGEFTDHARATAAKNPRLQLIDGDRLREMLPEYAVPVAAAEPVASAVGPVARSELPGFGQDWALTIPNAKPVPSSVRSPDQHTERYGRRRRQGAKDLDGAKAILGLIVLVALGLWQCSRPDPVGRVRAPPPMETQVAPVQPAPTVVRKPVDVLRQSAVIPARTYSERELQERAARADEAIKVIEATTPEM